MYEKLIQKLLNRNVGAIGGTLTPTGGTTYCTIESGSFSNTYDGYTATYCCFKTDMSCLSEWYWSTPVDVTRFNILSLGYGVDSHIAGIWGRVNDSWVQLWSGTWHPTHAFWSSKSISCDNCTGIRISQFHDIQPSDPCILEVSVDYTESVAPSGTASFQESSVNVGDVIHADFTWTNAIKHVSEYIYAVMRIVDPTGDTRTVYFEYDNDTGSHSLSFATDMSGTWTALLHVANLVSYIEFTDTVVVGVPGDPTLTEAITCRWVDGFQDHGEEVTQFDISETVYAYAEIALHGNDAYGKVMKHEWWYNGVKRWEWETTCSQHYTNNWAAWTWWAIGLVHGAGTGYIKIFFDGAYMGKTSDYTIVSGEGDANIIGVDKPPSFTPGISFDIVPTIRNDGADDHLFIKLTDTDTGAVLEDYTNPSVTPSGLTWIPTIDVTLVKTTDFHGRVDAGHVE